jgi:hypothetical protein
VLGEGEGDLVRVRWKCWIGLGESVGLGERKGRVRGGLVRVRGRDKVRIRGEGKE